MITNVHFIRWLWKSGVLRSLCPFYMKVDSILASDKALDLDAALGCCTVQYREVQGQETEKFLSYFKPCIIPVEGKYSPKTGIAGETYQVTLLRCKGDHVVRVKEVICVCIRILWSKKIKLQFIYILQADFDWSIYARCLFFGHHWTMTMSSFWILRQRFFFLLVVTQALRKKLKRWRLWNI